MQREWANRIIPTRASRSNPTQLWGSKPNQATWYNLMNNNHKMRGKGGKTKRGWKPCRTVPWHLCPGYCQFWTAQRQIVLLDGDYWPLGLYHLNFPWCTPANREQGIKLNYHKLRHAESKKGSEEWGSWRGTEEAVRSRNDMQWTDKHAAVHCQCKCNDRQRFYNRQLVVASICQVFSHAC